MQYDYADRLAKTGTSVTCEVDAAAPVGIGVESREHVRGTVELTNTGSIIAARGQLTVTVILQCSRCLAEHEVQLDIDINEECRLAQVDEPVQVADDEPEPIPILNGTLIDLTELVRQVIVLNIPPRSLCQPHCKGICPHCGQNLNDGECDCEKSEIDERWAPLQDLLDA